MIAALRNRRSRVVALAVAAAAVAAVLAWIARPGPPRPAGAAVVTQSAPPRVSVAVLGFQNLSGRPETAWLSVAFSEALTLGLGAQELRVIPGDSVARLKQELSLPDRDNLPPEMLTRVRELLGADLAVLGAYEALGREGRGGLELSVRVLDTATGRTKATLHESGSEAGLMDLVSRTEARLRQALGIGEAPSGGARIALPADPETARLYAEGLGKLRLFDAKAARERLDRAVAADPRHPLLRLALGEAWSALGHDARAQEETRRAFELATDLPLAERLAIEGRYREVAGQWARAAEAHQTLWKLFPDSADHGLRFAAARSRAGGRREALETVAALRKLPRPASEDPRIDLEEARIANALGDYPRAQSAAARAAAKGAALGARLLVAEARLAEAYAFRAQGQPASAVRAHEEARRIYEEAGDRRGVARALLEAATVFRYQGELARSRQMAEEALALSRLIGDRGNAARALNRIAGVLAEEGRLAEARRMYEETLPIWRGIGDRSGEGTALNNVGETLWKEGDLTAARRRLEECVALFREAGSRRGLSFGLFNLGFVLLDMGELEAARKVFEESLSLARAIGERGLAAVALEGLGRTAATQGDAASARAALDEALKTRRDLSERGRVAESLLALAVLAVEERRHAEAVPLLSEAIAEFRSQGMAPKEALAHAVLAQALLAQSKLQDAQAAIEKAESLSGRGEHRVVRLEIGVRTAALQAVLVRPAEAVKTLKAVMAEARRAGFVGVGFDARIALAEVERRFGDPAAARATLEKVAVEAKAKGFGLVARKAEAALAGP